MNLTLLDFVVIAVPLILVIGVSLFMKRYMRSVADFLAANRCAGRYLICTAMDATGGGVILLLISMEVFSKVGFSLVFWSKSAEVVTFFLGMLGLVTYRFRETRALTFHQFFEIRYSKGIRVFASGLNVFSGLFNFGVQPAVGARFFVYFCGMPEVFELAGMKLPTFAVVMVILMGVSLFFALTGGQISVMVTDCLEGLISSLFYLVVAIFLICTLTGTEVREALLSGAAGTSYVDPFDIGARTDFNGWYVIFGIFLSVYFYRGNAWTQGFAAAAKTAHEGRMAQILGNWRGMSYAAMGTLVSIAAFTVLTHPDFSAQQAVVEEGVRGISDQAMQGQLRLPMALGLLLAPGVKGAFCAVLLFGVIASQGVQLHGYGSTILQDVVLPIRKRPLDAKSHIRWLRLTVMGVAAFACTFSYFFKPVEYLVMVVTLIGAIYLGGIGLVAWGGLYWNRGTTAGAWVAMGIGAVFGVLFNLVQQLWKPLHPTMLSWFGVESPVGRFLAAYPDASPLNGQQFTVVTAVTAGTAYVIVSLLTSRKPFNMDAMLHRGAYRLEPEEGAAAIPAKRSWFARLVNIDEQFTRGDKVLTVATVIWTLLWKVVALGVLLWTLFVGRLSPDWWFDYSMITGVYVTLGVGCITTVWFLFGASRDLKDLFAALRAAKRSDADDGTVIENLHAEEATSKEPATGA